MSKTNVQSHGTAAAPLSQACEVPLGGGDISFLPAMGLRRAMPCTGAPAAPGDSSGAHPGTTSML